MSDILLTFCITKEQTIQSVNKSHNHVTVTVLVLFFFFRFPLTFPQHIPIIETPESRDQTPPNKTAARKYINVDSGDFK